MKGTFADALGLSFGLGELAAGLAFICGFLRPSPELAAVLIGNFLLFAFGLMSKVKAR